MATDEQGIMALPAGGGETMPQLSYMDSYLTPVLVNAIKEMSATIETLQNRIETLENT